MGYQSSDDDQWSAQAYHCWVVQEKDQEEDYETDRMTESKIYTLNRTKESEMKLSKRNKGN